MRSIVSRLSRLARRLTTPQMSPTSKEEETALVEKGFVTAEELRRLKSGPQTTSRLLGKDVFITDSFWYLHSLKEIFIEETYRFRSATESPYILDCGANVGLSAIYFKRLFPRARVTAFEADASISKMLKSNLGAFGYDDVTVENKAVWTEDTVLNFAAVGSLGGKLVDTSGNGTGEGLNRVAAVPAIKLARYIDKKVDFLKIDIEGAEIKVVEDCAAQLKNVERLFVEYHSDPEQEQQLDRMLGIIRNAGFRIYIKEAWNNLPLPYLRTDYRPCYDLQLNVFAYRI